MTSLHRLTNYILISRMHAMLITFICAFIPIIGSLSILIAGLVTLRKGMYEGALVTFAATLPFIISYIISIEHSSFMAISDFFLITMVGTNFFVWFFAVLLAHYNNWNVLLKASLVIGVIAVMLMHFIKPNLIVWWHKELTHYLEQSNASMLNSAIGDKLLNERAKKLQNNMVEQIKYFATGLMISFLLLNVLLQVLLSRYWEAKIFNPNSLGKELRNIRLNYSMGIFFSIMLLFTLQKNHLAIDIMPVIYTIFSIAGLSLLHQFLLRKKYKMVWFIILYIAIILLLPESIILISFIALVDILFNLRNRFGDKSINL